MEQARSAVGRFCIRSNRREWYGSSYFRMGWINHTFGMEVDMVDTVKCVFYRFFISSYTGANSRNPNSDHWCPLPIHPTHYARNTWIRHPSSTSCKTSQGTPTWRKKWQSRSKSLPSSRRGSRQVHSLEWNEQDWIVGSYAHKCP